MTDTHNTPGKIASYLKPLSKTTIGSSAVAQRSARSLLKNPLLLSWLEIIGVIVIPLIIGVATIVVTYHQNQSNLELVKRQIEESRKQFDQSREETDRQRQEELLNSYVENMTFMLIDRNLREQQPGSSLQNAAIRRTISTMSLLNSDHNKELFEYLYSENLIALSQKMYENTENNVSSGGRIVDLRNTNLDYVDLESAELEGIDLEGVNLEHADLENTDLENANMKNSNLLEADLTGTQLEGANLEGAKITKEQLAKVASLKGAVLPDGSTYPSKTWPIPGGPKD